MTSPPPSPPRPSHSLLESDEATLQAFAGPIGSLDVLSAPAELLPSSTKSKFEVAWPTDPELSMHSMGSLSTDSVHALETIPAESSATSSSEVEAESSENSDTPFSDKTAATSLRKSDVLPPDPPTTTPSGSLLPPRISRAFSAPMPAQLKHLRHPSHNSARSIPSSPPRRAPSPFERELSLELADCVQGVLQTLLQLSPPHLLDPAKEQFAACTLQFPTPSVSALLTIIKNLNYISTNLSSFAPLSLAEDGEEINDDTTSVASDEFDVGEVLQSVGDVLGGVAAEAGVDLVLFHVDVGMKHVSVKGDECALTYVLLHVLRQVIATSRKGDTIELGLQISPHSSGVDSPTPESSSGTDPATKAQTLTCNFLITHKYAEAESDLLAVEQFGPRVVPSFESGILQHLLHRVSGSLSHTLRPTKTAFHGRVFELSAALLPGEQSTISQSPALSPEEDAVRQPFPALHLAQEPTLDELATFAETQLRGKRAIFHAAESSLFAHHLTSYLTTWGLDVSHVSTNPANVELNVPSLPLTLPAVDDVPPSVSQLAPLEDATPLATTRAHNPTATPAISTSRSLEPAFVIIDDDVDVLRARLQQIKVESPPLSIHPRSKRPSLAANHRPRSTQNIKHFSSPPPTIVVVHFTSLANYKLVKDAVQSIFVLSSSNTFQLPEILVIPKPAGPRRFLTALHTAINKPLVDPFFSPIATSPMSPGSAFLSSFNLSNRLRAGTPPTPGRQASTPSTEGGGTKHGPRSPRDGNHSSSDSHSHTTSTSHVLNPSPLNVEALEYFSETAAKFGGGSAASGMVIQSPDGRPAGIFFQPPSRQGSRPIPLTSRPMERETTTRQTLSRTNSASSARSIGRRDSGSAGSGQDVSISEAVKRSPLTPMRKISSEGRRRLSSSNEMGEPMGPMPVTTIPPIIRTASSRSIPGVPSSSRRSSAAGQSEAGGNEPDAGTSKVASGSGDPSPSASSTAAVPSSSPVRTTSNFPLQKATTPPSSPAVATHESTSSLATTTMTSSPQAARKIFLAKRPGPVDMKPQKNKASDGAINLPISVLIVEDNPINQTILIAFMKKRKIKYGVAKNGQEAVDQWRTGSFHLILMDIQMPVKNGITATKEIRALEKFNNIGIFPSTPPVEEIKAPSPSTEKRASFLSPAPVAPPSPFRSSVIIVALTASSLQSDRVAALAAGCNDFVTKPVHLPWLEKKIIEWGSIKALQMWADPEMARNFSTGQDAKAKSLQLTIVRTPRGSPSPKPGAPSKLETSSSTAIAVPEVKKEEEHSSDPPTQPPTMPPTVPDPLPPPRTPQPEEKRADMTGERSEVSGEEALRRHIKDLEEFNAQTQSGPVLLGRTLSTGSSSIEQILHEVDKPATTDQPPSVAEPLTDTTSTDSSSTITTTSQDPSPTTHNGPPNQLD